MNAVDQKKLEAINSLEFVDWSFIGDECEFVLVKDTLENRHALLEAGFTEMELNDPDVSMDSNELDVAYLAFGYAGATWFNQLTGFSTMEAHAE